MSSLAYMLGTGGEPIPVFEETVLEANACERGWAPLEGVSINEVAPWRLVFAWDTILGRAGR